MVLELLELLVLALKLTLLELLVLALKTRRHYDSKAIVRLYKCHVLSFIEGATPALYHAATTHFDLLDRILDRIQRRFPCEVGLTKEEAFLH